MGLFGYMLFSYINIIPTGLFGYGGVSILMSSVPDYCGMFIVKFMHPDIAVDITPDGVIWLHVVFAILMSSLRGLFENVHLPGFTRGFPTERD